MEDLRTMDGGQCGEVACNLAQIDVRRYSWFGSEMENRQELRIIDFESEYICYTLSIAFQLPPNGWTKSAG